MPQDNSLGIVTGLLLVAVVLAMIASFGRVSEVVQGPLRSPAYELAGV